MKRVEEAKRNHESTKLKNIDAIFNPKSVAVAGASQDRGKLGFHVLRILSVSSLPGSGNVAVVSGRTGPAMIAFDVCERMGLTVSPFSRSLQNTVNEILSPLTMRSNVLVDR